MRRLICLLFLLIPSLCLAEFSLFGSQKSAEQISPDQQRLEQAYLHLLGSQGANRDNAKALDSLRTAAIGGHPGAQTLLGLLYKQGRFVAGDGDKAEYWLEQGAEQGNPVAQYHLGLLLAERAQSNDDLIGSYVWWQLAKKNGSKLAARAIKELDYRLTENEKVRAETIWQQVQQERADRKAAVEAEEGVVTRPDDEAAPPAIEGEDGKIGLQRVTAQWVRNREAGNLFVIQGEAINKYDEPRSQLQVMAHLVGAQGQVLVEMSVYCGNLIKVDELQETAYGQILPIMQNPLGENDVNRRVDPGGVLPFVVVFRDVPPNVSQYTVRGRSLPLAQ